MAKIIEQRGGQIQFQRRRAGSCWADEFRVPVRSSLLAADKPVTKESSSDT
jgi:hypothetical protein